jgi:hypothetical protein
MAPSRREPSVNTTCAIPTRLGACLAILRNGGAGDFIL